MFILYWIGLVGGEEFAIILPENDKATGMQLTKNSRKTIEELGPT